MKTTHEIARELLAMPDKKVRLYGSYNERIEVMDTGSEILILSMADFKPKEIIAPVDMEQKQ